MRRRTGLGDVLPLLVFPALFEEKTGLPPPAERQERIYASTRELLAV